MLSTFLFSAHLFVELATAQVLEHQVDVQIVLINFIESHNVGMIHLAQQADFLVEREQRLGVLQETCLFKRLDRDKSSSLLVFRQVDLASYARSYFGETSLSQTLTKAVALGYVQTHTQLLQDL